MPSYRVLRHIDTLLGRPLILDIYYYMLRHIYYYLYMRYRYVAMLWYTFFLSLPPSSFHAAMPYIAIL